MDELDFAPLRAFNRQWLQALASAGLGRQELLQIHPQIGSYLVQVRRQVDAAGRAVPGTNLFEPSDFALECLAAVRLGAAQFKALAVERLHGAGSC